MFSIGLVLKPVLDKPLINKTSAVKSLKMWKTIRKQQRSKSFL